MRAALKVRHLGRYRDILLLLGKHVRGLPDGLAEGFAGPRGRPEELAADLERMGPTFVKLGQLLSTRSDLLPQPYVDALSRLQDRVAPFPFEEARRVVESELGVRLRKAFRAFDPAPLAAASLSQIHRAELRDGRVVAVKVQRPGLRPVVAEDVAALREAAALLDRHTRLGRRYEFGRFVEEFRRGILGELDFGREALNLRTLSEDLESFELIRVPEPHEDYTTPRVLTMDFVEGRKVTALSPLALNELDGGALAAELFRAYLWQILVAGFFHADPHPGNVLLMPGGRLAILDLGMVGRLGPVLQQRLLALFLAISEGRAEDAASVSIEAGERREGFREDQFRERVGALVLENRDATISQLNVGRIVFEIARLSAECGLRPPRELTLIGKSLLNLDQVVSTLDPDFDPAELMRDEASLLLQERMSRSMTGANMTSSLLEARDFVGRLPARLGKALDVLGGNELRVKVDALDENLLIQGMQKIANRIALGVVLAALIIGAALLKAPLLFAAAALGGLVMILDILYYDEKRKVAAREPPSRDRHCP